MAWDASVSAPSLGGVLPCMALHRRQLPVIGPCTTDATLVPIGRGRAWCEHCSKTVVRAGELSERELRTLLAAQAGQRICIEYDSRPDGTIVLRREPGARRPLLAATLAVAAACTGHGETTPTTWPDPEPVRPFDRPRLPDDDVIVAVAEDHGPTQDDETDVDAEVASNAEGETADATTDDAASDGDDDVPSRTEAKLGCPQPRRVPAVYAGQGTLRGAVVSYVTYGDLDRREGQRSDRLAYRPTRELWREFVDRVRARRAARRAR